MCIRDRRGGACAGSVEGERVPVVGEAGVVAQAAEHDEHEEHGEHEFPPGLLPSGLLLPAASRLSLLQQAPPWSLSPPLTMYALC
eukprot:3096931-Rhodomonas_salina.1